MFRFLPKAATLRRRRAAILGFLAGATLQLALAGVVSAVQSGGLSDVYVPRPGIYPIF